MSNFGRNLALWVIIALLLVVLFNLFQPGATRTGATQVAYSDFISEVNSGRVRDVVIQKRENDLALATFGRGFYILDDLSPLRGLTPQVVAREATLFPVKKASMTWS